LDTKQDVSQTCLDEEDKQNKDMQRPSKQKTPKKKTKNLDKCFLSPKSFKQAGKRLRYSRTARIVSVKEEVTNLESIMVSSPGGVREKGLSESEFFTAKLSIRDTVFCYDPKTQASYSPTIKAKGNARKKLKQVKLLKNV
jgi:hypothetical protein